MIVSNYTISFKTLDAPTYIPAVQGDTGRELNFSLADYTIPAGATARYYVQKPSGEAVYNNATITGNTILVELTAQALAEAGYNKGQVRITYDEEVITSFEFILDVTPFRGIDATESTTEMNIFDKAVEQAEASILENAKIQTAANMEELLSTTSDKVLVLHDDSDWGNGGLCWFENQGGDRSVGGYARTNGTRVYPVASIGTPQPTAVPVRYLTDIIKSWTGRTNIIHSTDASDYTGLFAENCVADSNGKYHMNCSDFLSAVLMGITYECSRYNLGSNKANIKKVLIEHTGMPQSESAGKLLGGLNTYEWAQWFGEQGRLYQVPSNRKTFFNELQFGDILFGSDEENSSYCFDAIQHCMIVIDKTIRHFSDRDLYAVTVAHCNSAMTGNEGTAINIEIKYVAADESTYYKYWARPIYRQIDQMFSAIIPKNAGTYTYDCILTPCKEVALDDVTPTTITNERIAGELTFNDAFSCTLDYLPVIPGSSLEYTGAVSSARGNYLVRFTEYDKNLNPVKRGTTLANNGASRGSFTLENNTRYVRFALGYSSSSGLKIHLTELDNFGVTVTPPVS